MTVPVQIVHPNLEIQWTEVEGPLASASAAEFRAPLDPEEGPVLRVCAVDTGMGLVLIVTALGLIADAVSLARLAELAAGQAPPGGADIVQYADYAAWQQELAGDDDASRFWSDLLSPTVGPTVLAVIPGDAQATTSLSVDATTVDRLDRIATATGVPRQDVWLAAWAIVVGRRTGQANVVVGLELDSRVAGAPDAFGPYQRIVPIPIGVAPSDLLVDVARRLGRTRASAARFIECSPTTTAPVLFSATTPVAARVDRPPSQVELRLGSDGESPAILVDGRSARADDGRWLADSLAELAARAERDQGLSVAAASVLPDRERRLLLGWARTSCPLVDPFVVHDRIADWATRQPDRVAVTDGERSLSYAELLARADRLAGALRDLGAGGSPVASLLPQGITAIAAIVGILRAGCAYVPLHVDHPRTRLRGQIESAGCRAVVTSAAHADTASAIPAIVIENDEWPDASGRPLPAIAVDRLAYLMFTSGSTGRPKAVSVSHRALSTYAAAILERCGDPARARSFGLVTSLTTDLGNTSVFGALVSGGTLHVIPEVVTADPERLGAYMNRHRVDVLKITPSWMSALLEGDGAAMLPSELLILGGERLSWELVDRIHERGGGHRILNHYGPTEATVGCLAYDVPRSGPHRSRPTVPIGTPLANAEVYVLDDQMQVVALGAPGELCVAGLGLAEGYWGDDQLTASRFVPHPIRPDERLYRTGDLGRFLPDGVVEILGRRDEQVKVRGFRVELGEVEVALCQHSRVQRAAAAVHDGQLVGYFVSHFHPSPTAMDLQDHLRSLLPEHMVPAHYVELDALPLTAGGKLDRQSLRPPGPEDVDRATHQAARTPVEARLAAIFGELLGLADVSVSDDFFALGGHSLLATQAVVQIRKQLGVDLPVHSLFVAPTVAELAQTIAEHDHLDPELARMIEDLADLSDEEATALLSREISDGASDG